MILYQINNQMNLFESQFDAILFRLLPRGSI